MCVWQERLRGAGVPRWSEARLRAGALRRRHAPKLPAPTHAAPSTPAHPPPPGAREGQRKNFDALRKALAQFTSVSEAAAALAAGVPAAAEAAVEAAPAAGAEPAAAAGLLEAVVGAPACTRLAPWSAWLHGQLAAVAPGAAAALDPRLLLGLLGVGCLLGALRLVVDMLLFVQHASAEPRDSIGLVTHYALRVGGLGGGASIAVRCLQRSAEHALPAGLPPSCWNLECASVRA